MKNICQNSEDEGGHIKKLRCVYLILKEEPSVKSLLVNIEITGRYYDFLNSEVWLGIFLTLRYGFSRSKSISRIRKYRYDLVQ